MAQLAFDVIARDKASAVFDKIGAKADKTNANFSKVGGGMTGTFGKIAAAVGGVTVGWQAWDKIMVGGFNRLANLDDARKRLDQMGLSTSEAATLMDGLTDTVTGTAFSLDAGAGAMTGFVAAGTDLDEVNDRLQMTADAAAFAQAPLDEIANIFIKIQSQGKLTGEELRMLQERGIPALQLLADAAGVSAIAMQEMISRGEVDAQRFFDLWETGAKGFGENNIKIEGAAKSMGDTIRGSLSNAEIALSRLGEALLDDFLPAMKSTADNFKSEVDGMIERWEFFTGLLGKAKNVADEVTPSEEDADGWGEWIGAGKDAAAGIIGSFLPVVAVWDLVKSGTEESAEATGFFGDEIDRVRGVIEGYVPAADAAADAMGENAANTEAANAHLAAYMETLQLATDPVFALNAAIEDVDAAQRAYNEAIEEHGPKSAEAEAAAFKLAGAVSKAEQAAINGDLSFEEFDAKLRGWVDAGVITADQASTIRGRVKDLTSAAEDYEGNYNATVTADTAGAYTAVDSLVRWIGGRRATIGVNIRTFGAGALEFHQGGIIPRAHSGMLLGGLSADERLVVGQTGERILSRRGTRALDALTDELGRARAGGGIATATGPGLDPYALAREFVRELRQAGLVMPRADVARRADLIGRAG